jgi:hypothetical protein
MGIVVGIGRTGRGAIDSRLFPDRDLEHEAGHRR